MVISMQRWVGKVAVVTGASSGIGAAIVEHLVKAGLKVAGLARRKEKVEELAKKLGSCSGKLYAIEADVAKEQDILKAFKWVKDNLGPVSILVNNAGVIKGTNLIEGGTNLWKETFDVNVLALCIATREAVKSMREGHEDGHIIHINSVAGHEVPNIPDLNVYPASKYAVTALTETLRQELNALGSKIRITSISPGAVRTAIVQAGGANRAKELGELFEKIPLLNAEDVADAVMYVLSTPPHVQVHELTIKPLCEPA